jgi:uncharacterized membrane protein
MLLPFKPPQREMSLFGQFPVKLLDTTAASNRVYGTGSANSQEAQTHKKRKLRKLQHRKRKLRKRKRRKRKQSATLILPEILL